MLKFLRNKHHQKKSYINLAFAIISPFLMWGVNTSQKESKVPSTLGSIENKKISVKDYLSSYKAVQHAMVLMYGKKAAEASSLINYKGEAWDRLLLLDYAKQQNLKTADSEVVEWLMNNPNFQDQGQFDNNRYKYIVNKALNSNARDFEEEIRGLLTINKVIDKVRSDVHVTDAELSSLYSQENSERDLLYGVLSWESEKNNVTVTDDDIQKIYPLVKDRLTDKKTEKSLSVEEAKNELKNILLKQKAVEAAVSKLNGAKKKMQGNELEPLLKDLAIEARRYEKFKAGDVIPAIGDAQTLNKILAQLKEGEVSPAFAAANGAGIVKVLKNGTMDAKKFETEKEAFRKNIAQDKTSKLVDELLGKLRNKLKIDLETMKKLFTSEEQS